VREAIAELAGQGLLRRRQGRETVIALPSAAQVERMLRLRATIRATDMEDLQEFREIIEVAAGLRFDVGADKRQCRFGDPRRREASQSLAHQQAQRGRHRHFVGGARADDRVGLDPAVGHPREVQGNAGHVGPADRLDSGLLDGVEDVPGNAAFRMPRLRQPGGMDGSVVMTLPKRETVGPAAHLGNLLGCQRPPRLRYARLVAVAGWLVRGIGEIERWLMTKRAQGRGQRLAEVLKRIVGLRHQRCDRTKLPYVSALYLVQKETWTTAGAVIIRIPSRKQLASNSVNTPQVGLAPRCDDRNGRASNRG